MFTYDKTASLSLAYFIPKWSCIPPIFDVYFFTSTNLSIPLLKPNEINVKCLVLMPPPSGIPDSDSSKLKTGDLKASLALID